jgi:hypothetical protein
MLTLAKHGDAMKYIPLLLILAFLAGALYFGWRTSVPRKGDFDAIEAYARSRGLQVSEVRAANNHWRYWLRGKLSLSNLARIYIVTAKTASGACTEIHMAVDPISRSSALTVLEENSVSA